MLRQRPFQTYRDPQEVFELQHGGRYLRKQRQLTGLLGLGGYFFRHLGPRLGHLNFELQEPHLS